MTFRVRDKIFVIGGEGADGISMKASLDAQADLLDLDPETFTKAPYVGRYGWVNVKLDRIDRRAAREAAARRVARHRPEEAPRAGARVSGAGESAELTIRPATPDDEPAMTELEHASAIHHATIDPDRWRVQSLEEGARSRRHWHRVEPRERGARRRGGRSCRRDDRAVAEAPARPGGRADGSRSRSISGSASRPTGAVEASAPR